MTSRASVLESAPDSEHEALGAAPDVRESMAAPAANAAPFNAAVRPGPVDKKRIEAIIAREYVGLRLLISRRTGDPHVAAEVLNDAICTTWEKWQAGQIADPEHIAGYVFQVALNHWRNRRRSMAERPDKRSDERALEALPSSQPLQDEGVEEHIVSRVRELIRGMDSVRDRTVLVRFYLEEQDRETICTDLSMTPAQFAKVLHRARGRLRQLVEGSGFKRSDFFGLALL